MSARLTSIKRGVTKIDSTQVSPQQCQCLATRGVVHLLQSLAVLSREERRIICQHSLLKLSQTRLSLSTLEHVLEFLARGQGTDDATFGHIFLVLAENVSSTG